MKEIILSIKPQYVERIMSGTKSSNTEQEYLKAI